MVQPLSAVVEPCDRALQAYGARPLRRAVASVIEDPLAEALLHGRLGPGQTAVVDCADDGSVTVRNPCLPPASLFPHPQCYAGCLEELLCCPAPAIVSQRYHQAPQRAMILVIQTWWKLAARKVTMTFLTQVTAEDTQTEASNIVYSNVAPSTKLKTLARQNVSANA